MNGTRSTLQLQNLKTTTKHNRTVIIDVSKLHCGYAGSSIEHYDDRRIDSPLTI